MVPCTTYHFHLIVALFPGPFHLEHPLPKIKVGLFDVEGDVIVGLLNRVEDELANLLSLGQLPFCLLLVLEGEVGPGSGRDTTSRKKNSRIRAGCIVSKVGEKPFTLKLNISIMTITS